MSSEFVKLKIDDCRGDFVGCVVVTGGGLGVGEDPPEPEVDVIGVEV